MPIRLNDFRNVDQIGIEATWLDDRSGNRVIALNLRLLF